MMIAPPFGKENSRKRPLLIIPVFAVVTPSKIAFDSPMEEFSRIRARTPGPVAPLPPEILKPGAETLPV